MAGSATVTLNPTQQLGEVSSFLKPVSNEIANTINPIEDNTRCKCNLNLI